MRLTCRRLGPVAALVPVLLSATCATGRLESTLRPRTVDPYMSAPSETPAPDGLHDVVVVGNNWAGTATIFDPHKFSVITTVDVVPDLDTRMNIIRQDPERARFVRLNRSVAGEDNDQLVDDLFLSKDGRRLFVSRPSLGDVAAIDLQTREVVWRTDVLGFRADHAMLSKNGDRLLVSATRARRVHALETEYGEIVGGFPSGDEPHESRYSEDGARIYHASIGRVFLPIRSRLLRTLKGDRWLQIVDAKSIEGKCRADKDPDCQRSDCAARPSKPDESQPVCIDMGEKLEQFGRSGAESAVRPMTVTKDERFIYAQISFLHGFVEYRPFQRSHYSDSRAASVPGGQGSSRRQIPAEFGAPRHRTQQGRHQVMRGGNHVRLCGDCPARYVRADHRASGNQALLGD